ncbi:MAG: hypothetical protein C5B49_03620 [Bdellovibrio sp.]|nr:MAG: hypothetical protein C5B49_03620 [Bdellovibrio sp.]
MKNQDHVNPIQSLATGLFALGILFSSMSAQGAFSPVSLSILPPIEFPPDDFTVTGVRASLLWGKQRDIYGLDFGLLGNITELTFAGVAVSGMFNITHGTTTALGLQLAGLANYNTNKTHVFGLQAALLNINEAESAVVGVQLAPLANLSAHTKVYGLQVSVYNKAEDVYGFQIGLVNFADHLHGIQIGLLNFNSNGPFAVAPLLNAAF